jgi:hypothetical protein
MAVFQVIKERCLIGQTGLLLDGGEVEDRAATSGV